MAQFILLLNVLVFWPSSVKFWKLTSLHSNLHFQTTDVSLQNVAFDWRRLKSQYISKVKNEQYTSEIEPHHDKTYKRTCAPSKDWSAWGSTQSDQSLLSAWRNIGSIHVVPTEVTVKTDAQADLSFCWVHMSFCWFCCALAQFITFPKERKYSFLNLSNYPRIVFIYKMTHVMRNLFMPYVNNKDTELVRSAVWSAHLLFTAYIL